MTPSIENTWCDLFDAALDGTISPDDHARLEAALLEKEPLRVEFTRYTNLHAATRRYAAHADVISSSIAARARIEEPSHANRLRIAPVAYGLAAALLFSAAVFVIYVFIIRDDRTSNIEDRTSSAPVATLIESTGTFIVGNDIANPGSEYASGDYSIESGKAQLLLTNRVTVELRGRTDLHVYSPMRSVLRRGAATFRCPAGTEGFTVELPGGVRIVDLGTAFTIKVDDDGRADVRVIDGKVEVRRGDEAPIQLGARKRAMIPPDAAEAIAVETGPSGDVPPAPDHAYLFDDNSSRVVRDRGEIGGKDGLLNDGVSYASNNPFDIPDNGSLDNPARGAGMRIDPAFDLGADQTISMWVYRESLSGIALLDSDDDESRTLAWLSDESDAFSFIYWAMDRVENGGETSFGLPGPSQWVHLALVRDAAGGSLSIYINGERAGRYETTTDAATTRLIVGSTISGKNGVHGQIDEVAFWNQPLTHEQIAWLAGHSLTEIINDPTNKPTERTPTQTQDP